MRLGKPFYFIFMAVLFCAVNARAADTPNAAFISGTADVIRKDAEKGTPVKPGDVVYAGDSIRTKTGGRAELVFSGGLTIKLAEKSTLKIEDSGTDITVSLLRGRLLGSTPKASGPALKILSPTSSVSIAADTRLLVFYRSGLTGAYVENGSANLRHDKYADKAADIPAGMYAIIPYDAPLMAVLPFSKADYAKLTGGME